MRNFFSNEGLPIRVSREKTGASGQVWTYFTYDRAGHVTSESEPTTSGTYDAVFNSTSLYHKRINFYDVAGNLISTVNRRGDTITMTYDRLNRLSQRNVPLTSVEAGLLPNS